MLLIAPGAAACFAPSRKRAEVCTDSVVPPPQKNPMANKMPRGVCVVVSMPEDSGHLLVPLGKCFCGPTWGLSPWEEGTLLGHPPCLPSLFPTHLPWSSPCSCRASGGAGGSPWVPLPSPNPPLYRTPSPATMPHPCAAPWITSHRRRRRRQWQKRLRTATSLRSASPKVRDQAEPGTPWRGGGGRGEAVANQCLQCYSPRAHLAQTELQILLPLWVGVPMPSRILPQPPPG